MAENSEHQRLWFHPICNQEEIDRVLNVKNADDYLLKVRAETIVDHMRLFRVYRNKALMDEKNWSLENSFDTSHYDRFLARLSTEEHDRCLETTFGNIFSNDPNGSIFATEFGPIITISDSLQFFLKFTHLALLSFDSEVPPHVRFNGLRIAIRVMMMTEALDFLMDPRGIVPHDVGMRIHEPISHQLQFIAGHEFAHHVLGHLDESKVSSKPVCFAVSTQDEDYKSLNVYNTSQQGELDADIQAIMLPGYENDEIRDVLEAALLWFGALELYEAASEEIFPTAPGQYRTHPSARDRVENLLTHIPTPSGFDVGDATKLLDVIDMYKKLLLDDVSSNLDRYEFYGSIYLDAPDTEWRGPELIDRVDYY